MLNGCTTLRNRAEAGEEFGGDCGVCHGAVLSDRAQILSRVSQVDNPTQPFGDCGITAVFDDMHFGDGAHWDVFAVGVADGDAEEAFALKNAFCVMAQGAMPEIRKALLGDVSNQL